MGCRAAARLAGHHPARAELFTNGTEWFGHKLNLAEGAVDSVLAAVATAMPETLIAVIDIPCPPFRFATVAANATCVTDQTGADTLSFGEAAAAPRRLVVGGRHAGPTPLAPARLLAK